MEPKTQVEIQLGHLCNNRCVFCVSGQETALGRARPLPAEPILASLDRAFASGHRKLTLLGGEPTLQPTFKRVAEHAIRLGFEEIVIFTNGVKTARRSFIEDVLSTGAGGRFTWRISIQGATEESHDRTTRRPGSYRRILRSMAHLRELGQRITVNMCVVRSNFESVVHFPELIREYGVKQLHLDMIRPMDAGARTETEYRDMIPRYSDLVPALEALASGVPDGFDLNIGNLPYCAAPHLSRFIHHDGETTYTVAVDGENELSEPWDKYAVKRRDKSKPEACRACVFDERCHGVFDKYREIYGTAELVPVTAEGAHLLARGLASSNRRLAYPLAADAVAGEVTAPIARRLARLRRAAPFGEVEWRAMTVTHAGTRVELELVAPNEERAVFWIEEAGGAVRAGYDFNGNAPGPAILVAIRAIMGALSPRLPIAPSASEQTERDERAEGFGA